ncbi:Fis family transcriptional regulator [candidate division LCP-89 bacterium B3_LCP]|uniref:DNA-binding transcriptional regulator NtrC n=1 Tax=candidate division LCP-89 bacterium B3_LCP TaxID=2012998 RepID=A0A532UXT9_UNCL8|nr:MAG: Fis family transcriptional regulator [candidate division LCP-89 bacterium B3_LCP]
MKQILIVDDDASSRESIMLNLHRDGWQFSEAADGQEALNIVNAEHPDLVICDIRMPRMDGLEFLKLARKQNPDLQVIMITAYDDMQTTVKAIQSGAYEYVRKPIDLIDLEITIQRALETQDMSRRLDGFANTIGKDFRIDNIIGKSSGMLEVFKIIGAVSKSNVTVLIRGDSGTGKELIAKAIHYNSPYRDHPFIPINCTAIPENLIESELFGHEKGSFTGAVTQSKGKFELAGEGTIFLDEIGDMPLQLQTKLLRVIQERTFERVGGNRLLRSEARIIAATHQDLERLLELENFREDLYYRLRVVELNVPPLRNRREDIPLLIEYLIEKINRDLGTNVRKVSPSLINMLTGMTWRGNVRELENRLRRAIVLCRGEVLIPDDFEETAETAATPSDTVSLMPFSTLAEAERDYILKVLQHNNWNKKRTCEVLSIARTTLDRKIEQYQLKAENKSEE